MEKLNISNKFNINSCSCEMCKKMCQTTPCIGTPKDIEKIIDAGFKDKLSITGWATGLMIGTHSEIINIIAPKYDDKNKACSFYENGLCKLHDLNLKPTEGKYATHIKSELTLEEFKKSPLYQCINEWEKLSYSEFKNLCLKIM